jgi:hypothetical protein
MAKNCFSGLVLLAPLTLALLLCPMKANAQWAVYDGANWYENMLQQINQLDQLRELVGANKQQLIDYKLQLDNLKRLPGALRSEVKTRLRKQLEKNIKDYGKSLLNKTSTQDPESDSYYVLADDIVGKSIGEMPKEDTYLQSDLRAVGLSESASIAKKNQIDRMHYERVTDDMRQVAVMRKNAEYRSAQANAIAEQMADLPDNNTVGAIQLLSAQNALSYAQNEDLLRSQGALLRNAQEQQLRQLNEAEAARRRELDRLARNKRTPIPTAVNMVP